MSGILLAATGSAAAEIELTNAAQVRALTPDQAKEHPPARLRGVVVSEAEGVDGVVMLDETAGIYLSGPSSLVSQLHRGDSIEAEGVCDPGEFAPLLLLKNFRSIGRKSVPPPRRPAFEQIISGSMDAQWIEIAGVVRSSEPHPWGRNRWKLELASGGGRLMVVVVTTAQSPEVLVDAEVRVRGICFYQVNQSRQVLRPELFVPHEILLKVERAPPTDPFATPVCPIRSLLQFAPNGNFGHRMHVRGVVTACQPGRQMWIQDSERGLRVQVRQTDPLQPGDIVDVLGFPIRGEYSPVLEDAAFQKSASGPPPEPYKLKSPVEALEKDAELVQVDAWLSDVRSTLDGCALQLTEGKETFTAVLRDMGERFQAPARWKPGSRLRLIGIGSVWADQYRTPSTGVAAPQSFQMLLRSVSDVAVLQSAPWLNWKTGVWLLGATSLGLAVIVLAVFLVARRRLRDQAAQRELAEAELSAILKERNRMAREIHDTLAQGLGAISMQLELAKDSLPSAPDGVQAHLEQASTLVRSSLADARGAIWNMRAQVLETGDLEAALKRILHQLTDDTKMKFHLHVSGQQRRLAPLVENDLLRIGQEAVTNAVRHGHPQNIFVGLEFGWKQVQLLVRDDGVGFEVEHPPPGETGFGLLDMRERAEQLGGQMSLQSRPGGGTEIIVSLPVPE